MLKFTLNLALVQGLGPRSLFEGSLGPPFLLLRALGQFEGLEKETQFEPKKCHDECSGEAPGGAGKSPPSRVFPDVFVLPALF